MADQSKSLVNTVELGRAIRRKREELGLEPARRGRRDERLGLDALAHRERHGQARRRQHRAPDLAGSTCRWSASWARARPKRATDDSAVVYFPHEATPDIVEAHLRADRNLTPETAKALSELFRVAYQQFSAPGSDNRGRKNRK